MSEFLDILENHRELLEDRGYDEVGLGSPEEPGLFMRKLEYLYSECIRKSEYNSEKQDFYIEAFGFFDNDKDMIRFNFHYEFNPTGKNIDLRSFSATMNGIRRTFLIGPNMYHLIHANKVHKTLCNERQLQVSGELTINAPDINKLVYEQDRYLEQLGYYKTWFAPKTNFIKDELKSTLEQLISYPDTKMQTIGIDRYLHFDQYDSTKFSFQYQFDPVRNSLHLESITAKTDDAERTFIIQKGKPLITLHQMFATVREANKIKKAKVIADYVPAGSLKKKI